jgi:hypothetical protein
MDTGFILLSDKSESLNGKLYALGGGWNTLRFPTLPHNHPFCIGLGVDVAWNETDEPHRLELRIEDPDGNNLADPFSFDFETGRPEGSIPGLDQRMVMSLETVQTFRVQGPHAAIVTVDEEEIGRSRFQVVQVPVEEQQAAG